MASFVNLLLIGLFVMSFHCSFVVGLPAYFPACPRGVGPGQMFSTDGCNDCVCARTGPACTGYTCAQCRQGKAQHIENSPICVWLVIIVWVWKQLKLWHYFFICVFSGREFYRDMRNKCYCGAKGTYACEVEPCHEDVFQGARKWTASVEVPFSDPTNLIFLTQPYNSLKCCSSFVVISAKLVTTLFIKRSWNEFVFYVYCFCL